MFVQTFLCKRCVDTPINGVDTTTQIQRQNFFRNQSTQVDTLSGQVNTRPSSQNSQFEELGQQVDTLSEQVDTGPSSQNSLFIIWTVCRHHHQGRSTHYEKFFILKWMGAMCQPRPMGINLRSCALIPKRYLWTLLGIKGPLLALHPRDELTILVGRLVEFLAVGEQEIDHTKLFFFPIASASTCADSLLEVNQSLNVESRLVQATRFR
ncbi:hypothetical protein Taro_010883 [Colocasia esculenta]|uniref:Uncharacterized protein n=1 Tax=Colocasia esculenta TaxID=4460 RepID=A0A843U9G7_COLES|nr:hypothetical protein [Colocasia esculenta]